MRFFCCKKETKIVISNLDDFVNIIISKMEEINLSKKDSAEEKIRKVGALNRVLGKIDEFYICCEEDFQILSEFLNKEVLKQIDKIWNVDLRSTQGTLQSNENLVSLICNSSAV